MFVAKLNNKISTTHLFTKAHHIVFPNLFIYFIFIIALTFFYQMMHIY